jgi:WD40 repeat protein
MNRQIAVLSVLAMYLLPSALSQQVALEPLKPIGVRLSTDIWHWMGFVAFRDDGKQVASDGATSPTDTSGDLSLWTFPDGRLVRKLPIRPLAISPDFKFYAGTDSAGVMSVGDVATGKAMLFLDKDAYATFAFGPDGRYLAESVWRGARNGPRIRVLKLPNLAQVSAFSRSSAQSLAFSPDGTTLASGHWDTVVLWNMPGGKPIGMLSGFGRYVRGLAFSRDGTLLAAGTDTGNLQVWDVHRLKRISSVELEGGDVSDPAFNPDGTVVAAGVYGTGTLWLIDARTGEVLDHRKISDLGCGSVAFSPDGSFLIAPSTGGIVTWPYDRGGTIRVFHIKSH